MGLLKCFLLCGLLVSLSAYPNGAPRNICGRYVPGGHTNYGTPVANGPQTGPYSVTVTPMGNGLYTVTLRSTTSQPFRGFVIQALVSWKPLPDGPTDIVGTFQPDFSTGTSQVRSCGLGGSNVLTHTSKADKNQIQATWQAPTNLPNPTVKFVATVVRDVDHFYVISSEPVNIQDQAGRVGQRGTTSGTGFNQNVGDGLGSFGGGAGTGNGPSPSGSTVTGAVSSFERTDNRPIPLSSFSGSSLQDPPPPIMLPNGQVSVHSFSTSQLPSFSVNTRPTNNVDSIVTPTRASPRLPPPEVSERQTLVTTVVPAVPSRGTSGIPVTVGDGSDTFAMQSDMSVSFSGSPGSSSSLSDFINSMTSTASSAPTVNPTPTAPVEIRRSSEQAKTNEPGIRIIEIPILPEGQTAALLNITREVRPSLIETKPSTGETIPLRRTMLSRDGNVLRLRVGPVTGQGQNGFNQGFNPSSGIGSQFGSGRVNFPGNQIGFNNGGRFGQRPGAGGSMFGGQSFGNNLPFGSQGFGGQRPVGPFAAAGAFSGFGQGQFSGGVPFGQGQTPFGQGQNTFGPNGQGTVGGGQTANSAQGQFNGAVGQTNGFGNPVGPQGPISGGTGQSGFGAQGSFGGQGQNGFGGGVFGQSGGQSGMFGSAVGPFGGQGGTFGRQGGTFGGQGVPFGGQGGPFGVRGPFGGQDMFGGDQFGGQPSPLGDFTGRVGPFGGGAMGPFGGATGGGGFPDGLSTFGRQTGFGGQNGQFSSFQQFGNGGLGQVQNQRTTGFGQFGPGVPTGQTGQTFATARASGGGVNGQQGGQMNSFVSTDQATQSGTQTFGTNGGNRLGSFSFTG